jgi:hypothetical protein
VSAQNLKSIKVHQPGIEAAWSTTAQLREAAELVVQEVWQESLLPREEEGSDSTEDHGPPLDNSTIHWKPPDVGIVLLELFGSISTGLAAVLQPGSKFSNTYTLTPMMQLDKWPNSIHEDCVFSSLSC